MFRARTDGKPVIRTLLAATSLAAIGIALGGATARAAETDPYLWLESVDSPRAMAWVNARNAYSTGVLEADARYPVLYQEALAIAGASW